MLGRLNKLPEMAIRGRGIRSRPLFRITLFCRAIALFAVTQTSIAKIVRPAWRAWCERGREQRLHAKSLMRQ